MFILAVCLAASVAAMPATPPAPAPGLHEIYDTPSVMVHTNMFVTPEDAIQPVLIPPSIPKAPELPPLNPSLIQSVSKSETLLDENSSGPKLPETHEAEPDHFEDGLSQEPKPAIEEQTAPEKAEESHEIPENFEAIPFDKPEETYFVPEKHEIPEKLQEKPEVPIAPAVQEKPLAPEIKPEPQEFAPVIVPLEEQRPHIWLGWSRWPTFSLPSLSTLSNLASYIPILQNAQLLPPSFSSLSPLSNIPSSLTSLPSLPSVSSLPSVPSLSSLSSMSPVSYLPSLSKKPFFVRNYENMVLPNHFDDQQYQRAHVYVYV